MNRTCGATGGATGIARLAQSHHPLGGGDHGVEHRDQLRGTGRDDGAMPADGHRVAAGDRTGQRSRTGPSQFSSAALANGSSTSGCRPAVDISSAAALSNVTRKFAAIAAAA